MIDLHAWCCYIPIGVEKFTEWRKITSHLKDASLKIKQKKIQKESRETLLEKINVSLDAMVKYSEFASQMVSPEDLKTVANAIEAREAFERKTAKPAIASQIQNFKELVSTDN